MGRINSKFDIKDIAFAFIGVVIEDVMFVL